MEGASISLLGSELQIIVFCRKEHLQKQIPEQNTRFCSVETALQGKRIAVRQEEIVGKRDHIEYLFSLYCIISIFLQAAKDWQPYIAWYTLSP